jgi:hypothetical protein
MNFVRFIENRYQELTLENESHKDAFNAKLDSEIKAAHQLLSGYRWVFKWFLMPKILFDFLLVKLNLKEEPKPVIMNRLIKEREAKRVSDASTAKLLAEKKVTTIQTVMQNNKSESPTAG